MDIAWSTTVRAARRPMRVAFTTMVAIGGAIFNNGGIVSVFASSFVNNNVVGGLDTGNAGFGFGGAVCTTNGSLNMVNCVMADNVCVSGSGLPPGGSYG